MAVPPSQRLCMGILTVFLLLAGLPLSKQKCVFDEVQAQVRLVRAAPLKLQDPTNKSKISEGHPSPSLKSSIKGIDPPQPIRIRTWVAEESDDQSEKEKQRLEAAVQEAVRTVSSLLSVNRVTGPLLLKRDINKYCKFLWRNSSSPNYNRCGRANKNYRTETCLDVIIPDEHLEGCDVYPEANSPRTVVLRPKGEGLTDTDFLLYFHVRATDKCRAELNVQAYAVHCQTDSHGRPVAGVVVICRERLTEVPYNHQATVQKVIHELFHALGFSKELFPTWRDCSSSSPQGCSPRAKMIRSDASGQMRIYSQSVTAAMQKHLGTTDPDIGGPLENKDAGSTGVSSHWESRVMQGSIMAAVLGDPTTVNIDPVTLAALQDTGWYTVKLTRAHSLVWGEGEGSMFGFQSTCHDNSSTFFCSGSSFGCHYLHLHKGQCQTDACLDGCHIYKPIQTGSECWKLENGQQTVQDEIFGFESRCFFSNLTKQDAEVNSSVEGRCYRHRCTGLNTYQIHVSGSDWVDCPAGGAVQVKGYWGSVWCPDRRLCLPDVAPLSVVSFLSFNKSDPTTAMTQNKDWFSLRTSTQLTIFTLLWLLIFAGACFLVVVLTSFCHCCKVRVHSIQDEYNLQRIQP